jgi:hypothetical protein
VIVCRCITPLPVNLCLALCERDGMADEGSPSLVISVAPRIRPLDRGAVSVFTSPFELAPAGVVEPSPAGGFLPIASANTSIARSPLVSGQ